jgi:hypothetical protein
VRLLSDTPKGNRWIWNLEKDGRTVVPYDEVVAAVRHNNSLDPLFALALALLGGYLPFSFARSINKSGDST